MKKFLFRLLILVCVSLSASLLLPAQWISRPRASHPELPNEPANVTLITLDRETVYSGCAGKPGSECDETKIKVTTRAEDKENEVLLFTYTLTGGKIVGQGPSVTWDLSGVSPGMYSITAGVDDGGGIRGRTITKTVEVKILGDGVKDITLSPAEVCRVCPFRGLGGKEEVERERKENMMVAVAVRADARPDQIYYYAVSGGKITGDGPKVIWDLREALPGEYTITAGVGKDGVISGGTVSKKITMKSICGPCCMVPCECAVASANGPEDLVKPGDTIVFTSKVDGIDGKLLTYKWLVSAGTIISDPTGTSIMVKVPKEMKKGDLITATFYVEGTQPGCNCPNEIPITVMILTAKPYPEREL